MALREIDILEHLRRRREKQDSMAQNRSQLPQDTSLDRDKETHIEFLGNISRRTLQQKIPLSSKRRQDYSSRLSREAVEATRILDRQRKQKTETHKGLEGYETFRRVIYNPREHRCEVCSRFMYEISLTHSRLTSQQIRLLKSTGYNFTVVGESISIGSKCLAVILRYPGKLAPQALHNCLDPGPISRSLSELSHMELDFIKRLRPFMKIRKLPPPLGKTKLRVQWFILQQISTNSLRVHPI